MEEILRQLIQNSNQKLNSLNVEFSETMQPNFDSSLNDAAKRMVEEKRTSFTDIQEAKRSFNIYIDELAKYKENQFGSTKDIIRYTALNESRMSICPLWPIC